MWQQRTRVEELDSDDTDTQGVGLNFVKKRFASDPLHFTGIDISSGPKARKAHAYDTEESSEDSEEEEVDGTNALQVALRDKEEALVQSALARIRRAQEKGKLEVKLNQDELDALEKRRKRMQAAATSKARKAGGSDRGSGSEKRRRGDKQLVTVPISAVDPGSNKKKGKSRRIEEQQLPHPPAATNPPGMVIAGPDGLAYAPIGYYPPQMSANRGSPTRPRSATSHQLRGTPPPQVIYQGPGNPRHFSDNTRPTSSSSSSSRRPLPDEEGWLPAHSRRSSVSSQHYPVDPFEYQVSSEQPPPIPHQYMQPQTGRRNFSGPAEIAYSSLKRSPPIPTSGSGVGRASDYMTRRHHSGRGGGKNGGSSSEEDESDDLGNGVQVFVEEPEPERERAVVPRKAVGGSSGKKKGKR